MNSVQVSVIIPVFNDSMNLDTCLKSISETSYQDFEVIVVDDHSDEDIRQVSEKFSCKYIHLSKNGGPAAARNVGVSHSRGNILIFTDSDCVAPKDWVRNFKDLLQSRHQENSKVMAIAGKLNSDQYFIANSHAYSLYAFVMNGKERQMDFLNTSCAAIFKNTFQELGGFSESMRVGEDYDLALKLVEKGNIVLFSPEINVFHNHGILTIDKMFKKNFTYGLRIGLALYKNHPSLYRKWYAILSNPILHSILIIPLTIATTFRILKYNICDDWKVIIYSPLILINKFLFRIGIFCNQFQRRI